MTEKIEPLEESGGRAFKRSKTPPCTASPYWRMYIEMGFILSDITTSLERIADHCSNIGVCVAQVREDLYDTHSHLDTVKDSSFYHELEEVREKYQLP